MWLVAGCGGGVVIRMQQLACEMIWCEWGNTSRLLWGWCNCDSILAMRNVTCGGVILGCYDASVAEKCDLWLWWLGNRLLWLRMQLDVRYGNDLYCYNGDCHEDGATVIVWEWLRTWCLLAMRNVTCGCGGGVILGCYEDATVAEIWEWPVSQWPAAPPQK